MKKGENDRLGKDKQRRRNGKEMDKGQEQNNKGGKYEMREKINEVEEMGMKWIKDRNRIIREESMK